MVRSAPASTETAEEGCGLVFLARDREGFANLSRLLSASHRYNAKLPSISFEQLRPHKDQLFVLTGGRESWLDRLIIERKLPAARQWLSELYAIYGEALFIELAPSGRPGDRKRLETLSLLSREENIPCLLSNDVRYASRDHFPRYDALTCVRLGLTVDDPHPQRPVNDRAYLCSSQELLQSLNAVGEDQRKLYMQALERTQQLAFQCQLDLLPDEVTPPSARLPEGKDPQQYLRELCQKGLQTRYKTARPRLFQSAQRQLEKELLVVEHLELCEFFLVVHEVTEYARQQGIRCAGRGSAANSIIAYLLGITAVDPLVHHLLFERFLHRGRKGMPDIDVDFDSERRPEIIAWMEKRFGEDHCAMTGTLQTYQLRGAMREMMKVLGWDAFLVDRCCKLVGAWDSISSLQKRRSEYEAVLGATPLLDVLFKLVEGVVGCPRHLGLHSGGVVLTRRPLPYYSPIQTSAGGYRQVQFDKDDVEALGLIKFDVLGLRMLAVLSEAVALHYDDTRKWIDLENLPPDDPATYDLICSGETMSLFQIESPGQMSLLARTQPRAFGDLVVQVALFRPGPLQGGMVHPFLLRRAGIQEVENLHPCLEPILRDTHGVIVFQEQVLEICHQFAGLSLEEADQFRSLMSKWRDPGNMQAMGEEFIERAMATHSISRVLAQEVFRQVSAFVGYGFCRSHAAAFARTVYQSAYLKKHFPAAYMAAVMQHLPGFFPKNTVLEEARHLQVKLLPVCVLRSGIKYRLEQGAIRLPFTQVKEISEDAAQELVQWQKWGTQKTGESFWDHLLGSVPLALPQWESLARAGAFEAMAPRREALWRVGACSRIELNKKRSPSVRGQEQMLLANEPYSPRSSDFGMMGQRTRGGYRRTDEDCAGPAEPRPLQLPLISSQRDLPELEPLRPELEMSWDFATQSVSTADHPMMQHRPRLNELGVLTLASLKEISCPPGAKIQVKVAGWVLVRQRPPTAKGMVFVLIEDETARIQVAVPPPQSERWHKTLLRCQSMLVIGQLEGPGPLGVRMASVGEGKSPTVGFGKYRSIMLEEVYDLEPHLGRTVLAKDDLGPLFQQA